MELVAGNKAKNLFAFAKSQNLCEEKNGGNNRNAQPLRTFEFSKVYSDMCTLYISTNSTPQMNNIDRFPAVI